MSSLQVGVNLLYLDPGVVGGSEVYTRQVLLALGSEAADDVELTLFVNRQFPDAHPDLSANHRTVIAPISGASRPIRILMESTWLAREASRRSLHLVHHVANTIPHVRTRPAVVTIHDLQPIVRPQDLDRIKGAYLRRRLQPAARKAKVVTTPSEYTRRLVIERLHIDEGKVIVVPVHLSLPTTSRRPGRGPDAYGVDEPFFLYAAITHPHKNHPTLLRAFARVVGRHPSVSLVLTGGRGVGEDAALAEVDRLGLGDRVRRLGRIPRADLELFFRQAVALTFPSRHEGYGLPLAEAMLLGCPVIASNVTAVPEIVGDAGILVDPDDIGGWADAMLLLLADGRIRPQLIAAGRDRARSLSPEETARRQVAAYRLAFETLSRRDAAS